HLGHPRLPPSSLRLSPHRFRLSGLIASSLSRLIASSVRPHRFRLPGVRPAVSSRVSLGFQFPCRGTQGSPAWDRLFAQSSPGVRPPVSSVLSRFSILCRGAPRVFACRIVSSASHSGSSPCSSPAGIVSSLIACRIVLRSSPARIASSRGGTKPKLRVDRVSRLKPDRAAPYASAASSSQQQHLGKQSFISRGSPGKRRRRICVCDASALRFRIGGAASGGGLGVRPAQLLATVSLAGSGARTTWPACAALSARPTQRRITRASRLAFFGAPLRPDRRPAVRRRHAARILRRLRLLAGGRPAAVASAAEEADALALMDASVVSASAIERAAALPMTPRMSRDRPASGGRVAALAAEAAPACRTSVLLLLLHCLTGRPPTWPTSCWANRMDGRLAETQLQTCLHSLMSLMRRAADPAATAVFADSEHADFALAYRLAFCLAVNVDTVAEFPALPPRRLRVLSRPVALPAGLRSAPATAGTALTPRRQALGRLQKAWLLRLLAVDLRCAALSKSARPRRQTGARPARRRLDQRRRAKAPWIRCTSYGAPQRDDTLLSLLDSLASEKLLAAELADDDDEIAAAASGTRRERPGRSSWRRDPAAPSQSAQRGGDAARPARSSCRPGPASPACRPWPANLYSGAAAAAAAQGPAFKQRAELEAEIRLVLRLAEKRNAGAWPS
uniref:AMP-binding domain-containing protein n=1 Tax=Macrostomum lignano TaxID=282301 RepID=A0A1I8JQV4_9PLAT